MSLRPVADEANVGMTRETISGVIMVYRMMGTDRTFELPGSLVVFVL
jgi:hypothetical protein